MVFCSVLNCKIQSGQGIAMFKFPEKDLERRQLWIDKVALKRKDFQPSPFARVCARHFTNDQFVIDPSLAVSIGYKQKQLRLKENAVPTIFDNYSGGIVLKTKRTSYKNSSSERRTKRRKKYMFAEEDSEDSESLSSSDTDSYDAQENSALQDDTDQLIDKTSKSIVENETISETLCSPMDSAPKSITGRRKPQKNSSKLPTLQSKKRKKVICAMSRKNATQSPNFVEKRVLAANGLGDRVVEFPVDGDSEDVTSSILREFPKLQEGGGFIMYWADENSRNLIHLASSEDSCNVDLLFRIHSGSVYVKPTKNDLEINKDLIYYQGDSETWGECQICGKLFLLEYIEDHVNKCRTHYDEMVQKELAVNRDTNIPITEHQPSVTSNQVTTKVETITTVDPQSLITETNPESVNTQLTICNSPTNPKQTIKIQHVSGSKSQSTDKTDQVLVVTKDPGYVDSLRSNFFAMQQEKQLCDVLLKGADNSYINAHKLVLLASGSPYFHNMLSGPQSATCDPQVIDFTLYPFPVLESLIRYLYTGEIMISRPLVSKFNNLCGVLKLNAQNLLKHYFASCPPTCNFTVSLLGAKKSDSVEENGDLSYLKSNRFVNAPKRLSEKLRDIIEKNEKLFKDVGMNSNANAKLKSKQKRSFDISQEDYPIPGNVMVKSKAPSFIENIRTEDQIYVKTEHEDISVEHSYTNTVNPGQMFNISQENDTEKMLNSDYLEEDNSNKLKFKTNCDITLVSDGHTVDNISDVVVKVENVDMESENIHSDYEPKTMNLESESAHGHYVPDIVIKTEPCDEDYWQKRPQLGLELETESYEGLGSVTVKEEPLT
ncbi:unnamed protein product [Mytilus coruscus]|uniref:BTB domain-containing protein n=1 Tax=Mytilus coruscus TaxID=42192 RepID=A0A6J8CQ45_MYTCO|nr:unnamed protein product [Mytilus coruscus]